MKIPLAAVLNSRQLRPNQIIQEPNEFGQPNLVSSLFISLSLSTFSSNILARVGISITHSYYNHTAHEQTDISFGKCELLFAVYLLISR